jgi:Flp pilus assembly protein TadD
MEEHKPEQAMQLLESAAVRHPQDVGVQFQLAVVYDTSSNWDKAQKAYSKVLELDSSNSLAQNNLAWLLAEHGGNIDVALKLAQQAKEKLADNPQVDDTIGWIYYKKSSYQMALNYLRSSAEKDPKSANYQYHLGMAYMRLGKKEDARRALRKTLELNPKFPESGSVQSALAEL